MAYIKSATFGDERGARDITSSLSSRISGNKIDVVADSSLIPMFEVSREVSLTQQEIADIREQARKQCSGGQDTACITSKTEELKRQRLQDKTKEREVSANVVKGRRLTVTIVDKDGKTRDIIVPDGQKFTMEDLKGTIDANGTKQESSWKMPSLGSMVLGVTTNAVFYGTIVACVFVWTLGMIVAVRYFMPLGLGWWVLLPLLVSASFPGAGLVVVALYHLLQMYVKANVLP
jgi:hypothetical protein